MKSNIGPIDKAIRLFIALVLIVLFYENVVTGTLGIIVLVLASVVLLTALVGFCPLYLPFGISTHKKKE